MKTKLPLLQIIVPVYNEEAVLPKFNDVILNVISKIDLNCCILYVNDGSSDNTLSILKSYQAKYENIDILDLSRNFGQVAAIRAGLDYSDADLVVIIDSDLQHPPEIIPDMVKLWQEGSEIVSPVYQSMSSGLNNVLLRKFFYKVFSKINPKVPQNAAQCFFLLDRKVVKAINECREHQPFLREILAFVGFKETTLLFNKHDRQAGYGKWTLWKQWNYAISGVITSTTLPLKLPSYISMLILMVSLLGLFFKITSFYLLLIVVLSILNLFFMGIMGEYLSYMFCQTRNRPLYFVKKYYKAKLDNIP